MQETWTILRVLRWTTDYFRRKGLSQPRADAEVLLADVLKTERLQLYLRYDQPLDPHELAAYRDAVKRRANREPTQYITGRQEFWSLDLEVSPAVLIPRPETELLVEICLKLLNKRSARVLDLCTGSGAVALALAKERGDLRIVATDRSFEAVALARRNAARNGLEYRVDFLVTDLFSGLQSGTARFDAILSNPPYIGDAEFPDLAPEVREHEPELALRGGGAEGIDLLTLILDEFDRYLEPGGALLLEIGHSQRDLLTEKACHLTGAPTFEFHKDYSDLTRILHITTGSR
jgi:release factor glutamine methyltransferase